MAAELARKIAARLGEGATPKLQVEGKKADAEALPPIAARLVRLGASWAMLKDFRPSELAELIPSGCFELERDSTLKPHCMFKLSVIVGCNITTFHVCVSASYRAVERGYIGVWSPPGAHMPEERGL